MDRQVKGIWIPIEIWESNELSWNEKVLLMEIDSYTSRGKDCYFSNEFIAALLGVADRCARQCMSNLINGGYVRVVKFDGRRRYVESTLISCQAGWQKNARQGGKNMPHTNNRIDINKSSIDIEDNKNKAVRFPFKKSLIEMGVSEEVAEAWMAVRKAKKAVNSEIAFNAVKREIAKAGLTPDNAIRIAVERSWCGFQADWLLKDKERKVAPKERKESVFEHNIRVFDQMNGTNNHELLYGKKQDIYE